MQRARALLRACLAGQRARAEERDPARVAARRRRTHRAGGPRPAGRAAATAPHGDDEPDRDAIEAALRRAGGVISQAAARTGPQPPGAVPAPGQARHRALTSCAPASHAFSLRRQARRCCCSPSRWSRIGVDGAVRLTCSTTRCWPPAVGAAAVRAAGLRGCAHRYLAPQLSLFRALSGSVASFRDGDFSFSLARPLQATNSTTWSPRTTSSATCCARSASRCSSANCCSTPWCRTRRSALLLTEPRRRHRLRQPRRAAAVQRRPQARGPALRAADGAHAGAAARGARRRPRPAVHRSSTTDRKRPTTSRGATSTSTAACTRCSCSSA